MKLSAIVTLIPALLISSYAVSGPTHAGGKITSIMASATEPAIRLTGNITPDLCDGGKYGWIYFAGTAEERNRIYASALALSISGKTVTVYTNGDDGQCRIGNIQTTDLG